METILSVVIVVIVSIILVLCGVVIGLWLISAGFDYNNLGHKIDNTKDFTQCSGLDLEDTSRCLQSYLSTFYNYVPRDTFAKDINDIIENGGDCSDYTRLYVQWAEDLGYTGKTVVIKPKGTIGHAFAIIGDKTGYCRLDQLNDIDCVLYEV